MGNIEEDDVFEDELDDLDLDMDNTESKPIVEVRGSDVPVQKPQAPQTAARPVGRPSKVPMPTTQAPKQAKPVAQAPAPQAPAAQEPQIIAVPRVVSEGEMLNTLYDGQQEIRQILIALFEKLNAK